VLSSCLLTEEAEPLPARHRGALRIGRKARRRAALPPPPTGKAGIHAVATHIPSKMRRPLFCPRVALQQAEQSKVAKHQPVRDCS
jgi:hypothetical protein